MHPAASIHRSRGVRPRLARRVFSEPNAPTEERKPPASPGGHTVGLLKLVARGSFVGEWCVLRSPVESSIGTGGERVPGWKGGSLRERVVVCDAPYDDQEKEYLSELGRDKTPLNGSSMRLPATKVAHVPVGRRGPGDSGTRFIVVSAEAEPSAASSRPGSLIHKPQWISPCTRPRAVSAPVRSLARD